MGRIFRGILPRSGLESGICDSYCGKSFHMNEGNWIEHLILAAILFFCLWYIYRSAKNLLAPKKPGGGCGGCSSGSSCSSAELPAEADESYK